MSTRLSRRKLAVYAAQKLLDGTDKKKVLKELAAYLVDTGRTREMHLIVRDIESELALRGVVIADIVSARPLTASMKTQIGKLIGAKDIQLRQTVDPSVLGGVRVDLPGQRFDGTIRHKLNALKASKV